MHTSLTKILSVISTISLIPRTTSKAMKGHWQKEVPTKQGKYWTATRDGHLAGVTVVAYDRQGRLVYAGGAVNNHQDDRWLGWWWSEPVEVPPDPPEWK